MKNVKDMPAWRPSAADGVEECRCGNTPGIKDPVARSVYIGDICGCPKCIEEFKVD